ncbi:UbiA-like polyprenyltransferase [Flavitalea sp. BT771]|uniref:UbiA-like polyprenyltransferase n=1 Tax=Flavitalea sp. BT771 TaxID=3063329 RepID=UPI0026E2DE4B|nr:UbiA-like polyprenyltransferase [Flavitalea sp. BT771]MDO6432463.1 UbiA-like polyprenyltransferase [Flavitalea sp. BT771]MDV6221372.1 UbiA-like polyprenyltransferase [Flavitalea sp. BT771]
MSTVKNYLSLIRFSHTIFAMPFAMIGFFLGIRYFNDMTGFFAGGFVSTAPVSAAKEILKYMPHSFEDVMLKFLLVVACMIFARSAAMAFNRWLDVKWDALNPRTAIREIPAGIISKNSALRFVIVNCLAFVVCTWFINPLCFALSFVALAVVLGYSYTKRFTPFCHLVLGVGLSLAPIGAYLAVTGHFDLLPLLFSFAVIFWVSGFDIIYALQDEEFDRKQNLYSMPSWLGKGKALHVSEFLHLLSTLCVAAAGLHGHFGLSYWLGVAVFLGMLIYQHAIVKPNDLSRVNLAFMTANGIASVVFAVFVISDLYLSGGHGWNLNHL